MKVPLESFRDPGIVRELAGAIRRTAAGLGRLRIMHVCGTHEHELRRHALRELLPEGLELIAGPGCPVCITPASAIITARRLALLDGGNIVAAYGDVLRVPTRAGSLADGRSEGGDVRLVYGVPDALRLARENPARQVIFFSVGFETTAAPVAALLGRGDLPGNFSIYTCHRYVPGAVEALVAGDAEGSLGGFLLPGHASAITGADAYEFLPARYNRPAAVAGFEPVDILRGVLSILEQAASGSPRVANCYERAVRKEGNRKAQSLLNEIFDLTDARWRGIGILPGTGFELKRGLEGVSALARFGIEEETAEDLMPGCRCHLVMMGKCAPEGCVLFGKECTPDSPRGPCMVGGEGTCRAHFMYGGRI